MALWIQISSGSGKPIYVQVAEQISEAIAKSELASGDKLPAVRKLAAELVINPNTPTALTLVAAFIKLQEDISPVLLRNRKEVIDVLRGKLPYYSKFSRKDLSRGSKYLYEKAQENKLEDSHLAVIRELFPNKGEVFRVEV